MCVHNIWGRIPKYQNLFIKNSVFILTCLNFSHLQSTLHLMQYTYRGFFPHCSKQFLTLSILMSFSGSAVFCFISSTMAKLFSLRTLLMRIPTCGIHVLWQQWKKSHGLWKSCGEKGMAWPLSKWERARGPERADPACTGFYCFSGHITSRMVLIYYAQVL